MTIVNIDSQIRLWEYQYKENHPYTGTTNEYKPKDNYIWIRPSITFARGGQRGRSLVGIYEDDQMVISTVDNYYRLDKFT